MINEALFSSKSDLWNTPDDLFRELDWEFNFTLDPCALPESAKCEKFYTPEDDGLTKNWGGEKVFCNPPYSDIKRWVQKCYEESLKPRTLVVMLIPARTDTRYYHDFIQGKAQVRFIRGRLKFSNSSQSAPFPSMIVVYGQYKFNG